jgi:hypothetical protein
MEGHCFLTLPPELLLTAVGSLSHCFSQSLNPWRATPLRASFFLLALSGPLHPQHLSFCKACIIYRCNFWQNDYMGIIHGNHQSQGLRTFIRFYSPFKSEQLSTNIKLTVRKTLITSIMTYASYAWNLRQIPICLQCGACKTRLFAPLAIFQGVHRFVIRLSN